MRTLIMTAVWIACVACGSWSAMARPANCTLTVHGRTYISGGCDYRPDADGSFQIYGGPFFAYVTVAGPGTAQGYWNGQEPVGHAHAPLGILQQSGACWQNSVARVCVWAR